MNAAHRPGNLQLVAPLPAASVATKRADLVDRYRSLGRQMNEFLSDSDWRALKRERDLVQVEIDALDAAGS